MMNGRIVVIGASSGGVRALQALAATIPADFPAPILAVQHIGSNPSILPSLLSGNGRLPASHAIDGEAIVAGHVYVAPPDQHMMVDGDRVRLSRAAKEHHTRPAIDPLFRSAGVSWGPAAIGVLLTGSLDDGTAGLQALRRCGGTVVVQDPTDAEVPSMPLSALRYVEVDYVVPLAALGSLLSSLVSKEERALPTATASTIAHEQGLLLGKGDFVEHLTAIGNPSTFVCPDCKGALWEVAASQPKRFRCHTGHAFTLRSLNHAQSEATDAALWGAFRALQEKEMLLNSLAVGQNDDAAEAARLQAEARMIREHAQTLRRMIESVALPVE
jgi:two-component system chemotaxis response regulator CheB